MADKSSLSTARQVTSEAPSPAGAGHPAPVPSDALLRGQKAVAITHNGMLYMLQATKLGKLILTK